MYTGLCRRVIACVCVHEYVHMLCLGERNGCDYRCALELCVCKQCVCGLGRVVHVCIEVCVSVLGMCVLYSWETMCAYGVWLGIHMRCGVQHTWNSYVLMCIYIYCVWECQGCM